MNLQSTTAQSTAAQSFNQLPEYPITRVPDSRVPAQVGRDARLELVFERRGGRTIVAHAYAEPPLRIGRAFAIGDAAYLIIVCTGPGVFGGDRLRQSIRVGGGARVVLTSQSALQVHPCAPEPWPRRAAPAAIVPSCPPTLWLQSYVVEEEGELHCHWDPVIPFADASLVQQFDLQLTRTSRMYWSDALMSGRVSRGETWRFRDLAHSVRLTVDGALQYLERFTLAPGDRSIAHRWVAAQGNYLGTTIVHHQRATGEVAEQLQAELEAACLCGSAVDLTSAHLLIARFLGSRGPSFAAARDFVRRFVLAGMFDSPQLAGRK